MSYVCSIYVLCPAGNHANFSTTVYNWPNDVYEQFLSSLSEFRFSAVKTLEENYWQNCSK